MPFTASELSEAGKVSLDFYLKNSPVDQVAVERPFFNALMEGKREFPGGKQYVVEQLRKSYNSNFQWINGAQEVTYNRRAPTEQASYAWRSAHDGYAIDEDRLAQNGITMQEGRGGDASQAERIQLTNLLDEQNAVLREGFREKFSAFLHLDGTSSSDAITGLDALVSLTPSSGTVGGIDASQSANAYWRNGASTGLTTTTTTGTILDAMETQWKNCVKNGGKPTKILAGYAFLDGYRKFIRNTYGQIHFSGGSQLSIEGGSDEVKFKGVPIEWCPEFDDNFGGIESPSIDWTKRCYFLNMNTIKLRPMAGQDMVTRKPPRAYNRYEYYFAITWKGALTTNRRNANAVLSIA